MAVSAQPQRALVQSMGCLWCSSSELQAGFEITSSTGTWGVPIRHLLLAVPVLGLEE